MYTSKSTQIKNNLGLKIRMLRELRNLSQKYMADELNLSLSGYGKLERGETDPSYSRLSKISNILDVSIEELIHFKPHNEEPSLHEHISRVKNHSGTSQNRSTSMVWDGSNDEVSRLQAENQILRSMINQIVSQI